MNFNKKTVWKLAYFKLKRKTMEKEITKVLESINSNFLHSLLRKILSLIQFHISKRPLIQARNLILKLLQAVHFCLRLGV